MVTINNETVSSSNCSELYIKYMKIKLLYNTKMVKFLPEFVLFSSTFLTLLFSLPISMIFMF